MIKIIKTKSFGVEVEFPLWDENWKYQSWIQKFDALAGKLPGKLYHDATPCGEYATDKNDNYNKMMDELFDAFKQIKELVDEKSWSMFLVGSYGSTNQTWSGHMHLGKTKNQRFKPEENMGLRQQMHGAQTLIELISQNKGATDTKDRRATKRDYFRYYDFWKDDPERNVTFANNDLGTVECRIPPSSDFFHLGYVLSVMRAWANSHEYTYGFKANWNQAKYEGTDGKYMIPTKGGIEIVNYQEYMVYWMDILEENILEEIKKFNQKYRPKIMEYHELFKNTNLSDIMTGWTRQKLAAKTDKIINKKVSFIDGLNLKTMFPSIKGKIDTERVAEIINVIDGMKETESFKKMKLFQEAIKRGRPGLAKPEDRDKVKFFLNKKNLKEAI